MWQKSFLCVCLLLLALRSNKSRYQKFFQDKKKADLNVAMHRRARKTALPRLLNPGDVVAGKWKVNQCIGVGAYGIYLFSSMAIFLFIVSSVSSLSLFVVIVLSVFNKF